MWVKISYMVRDLGFENRIFTGGRYKFYRSCTRVVDWWAERILQWKTASQSDRGTMRFATNTMEKFVQQPHLFYNDLNY